MKRLLWLLVAAYAAALAASWRALPHNLVLHFTVANAPDRFLDRGWFAALTLLVLAAAIAMAGCALPRAGECGRGVMTLSYGFGFGMIGFMAGVFWSLVRVNAGLGSPVRPSVAAGLALTAVGLILGVAAPGSPRRPPATARFDAGPPART